MVFRASRASAVVAVGLVVCGLAACSGAPSDDESATWSDWADGILSASDGTGVTGTFVDGAAPETFTPATPTAYTSVMLRCIGTDRANFELVYTGTDDTVTAQQQIVCHDGGPLTPVAVPTTVGEVESFAVSAASPDGEGIWVAALQK